MWRVEEGSDEKKSDDALIKLREVAARSRMIPVIGVPVINSPHHIRQLWNSINLPVQRLVFVHNRDQRQPNEKVEEVLCHLQNIHSKWVRRVYIHAFRKNLGVSAAWNMVILRHPAPWWLICNADVSFRPTALSIVVELMQVATTTRNATPLCVHTFGIGWSSFAITNHSIRTAGLFDENYYPAYSEDCDMLKRLAITRCSLWEGGGSHLFSHFGSASWRLSDRKSHLFRRVTTSNAGFNNWDYLATKFGNNRCDASYDRTPSSPSTWSFDARRRRSRGGSAQCVACNTAVEVTSRC